MFKRWNQKLQYWRFCLEGFIIIVINIILFFCLSEKPSLIIVVTVTIVNREYNRAYEDIESPRSRALILELDIILIPFCRQRFPRFRRIRYKRFFFGSLGIEYDLEFEPSTNVTNATVADEFVNANTTSDLQFLQFGRISAVEAEPTILPTGTLATPSSGKSGKRYSIQLLMSQVWLLEIGNLLDRGKFNNNHS